MDAAIRARSHEHAGHLSMASGAKVGLSERSTTLCCRMHCREKAAACIDLILRSTDVAAVCVARLILLRCRAGAWQGSWLITDVAAVCVARLILLRCRTGAWQGSWLIMVSACGRTGADHMQEAERESEVKDQNAR